MRAPPGCLSLRSGRGIMPLDAAGAAAGSCRVTLLGEPKPEFSLVVENYLQAIYKLSERGDRAFPTRLAEAMNVSVATTVGMVKRLVRQGLVKVGEDKEIFLIPKGRELAESVVRRHRLAERMLTDLLGVEWYKAHEEAHRFEHAISPQVEEKLAQRLGFPKTCPFGYPIPGCGLEPGAPPTRALSRAAPGEDVVIAQVPEEDAQLLEFFDSAGLRPGVAMKIKELAGYKGTITVVVNGRDVVLGTEVAARVLVTAAGNGAD